MTTAATETGDIETSAVGRYSTPSASKRITCLSTCGFKCPPAAAVGRPAGRIRTNSSPVTYRCAGGHARCLVSAPFDI